MKYLAGSATMQHSSSSSASARHYRFSLQPPKVNRSPPDLAACDSDIPESSTLKYASQEAGIRIFGITRTTRSNGSERAFDSPGSACTPDQQVERILVVLVLTCDVPNVEVDLLALQLIVCHRSAPGTKVVLYLDIPPCDCRVSVLTLLVGQRDHRFLAAGIHPDKDISLASQPNRREFDASPLAIPHLEFSIRNFWASVLNPGFTHLKRH